MKKSDIEILERQGCFSTDWSRVEIAEGTDISRIRNVYFSGPVRIGKGSEIINVPGGISNVRIGESVRIINVARIENTSNAAFGVGTDVAVLDETGGSPVRIYPGISAQTAAIAARMPEYSAERLFPMIDRHIAGLKEEWSDLPEIGDGAQIFDSGPITDVRIWPGVLIEGAATLHNGCVVGNQRHSSYIGQGVNAENFIIEDASVANGVVLRNSYVGQGSVIDKGFTAHDSLFFANCAMENGEACAVLAGPYTVSMHKSSLLIGCQTSFMNAGSGTNMSNHMYKLGPVHWGVLERGVKTSSNSYMMHGSRIGAFSLVMGDHKTHPDTSDFPFSYLFGDGKGNTVVVPAAMLRSYGLKRDGEKWPKRDRRLGHSLKLNDRISHGILTPHTAGMILEAIGIADRLLPQAPDKDGYLEYKGLKLKRSSLEKGRGLYELALCKYLQSLQKKGSQEAPETTANTADRWVDLLGQVMTESDLKKALKAESISDMEKAFDEAMASYEANERLWAAAMLKGYSPARASEFDSLIEKDRSDSLAQIEREKEHLSLL
ncbi:MAG: DUF4954 family protein [Muribaculaceae bacterium]|nr:DUF4954 family protein [Muribaculaceae bacterium]